MAHRSAQDWQREVDEWRASGESAARFAKRRGYSPNSLFRWRALEEKPGFVKLEVISAVHAKTPNLIVEVGGARIHVERGFDAELLRSVVAALECGASK